MGGTKARDRFAPPLMYAFRAAFRERDAKRVLDLKDESGERVIASRRASPRNIISHTALKDELSDDLVTLFNTVNMESAEDIAEFAYVTRSVLNYGMTDLAAISIDEGAVDDLGSELKAVLANYEPRLIEDSILIERDRSVDPYLLKIRFNVHAEMFASPVDVPVEFIADLELDSGKMKIARL